MVSAAAATPSLVLRYAPWDSCSPGRQMVALPTTPFCGELLGRRRGPSIVTAAPGSSYSPLESRSPTPIKRGLNTRLDRHALRRRFGLTGLVLCQTDDKSSGSRHEPQGARPGSSQCQPWASISGRSKVQALTKY